MKSSKKRSSSSEHEKNAKAIISLLVLLLALSILIVFYTYQDTILAEGLFKPFMTLSVVGMGLLVSLLFLVNNSSTKR